jgi:hypothetical protein
MTAFRHKGRLSDYPGQLEGLLPLRITDRSNSLDPGTQPFDAAGTVADLPLPYTVPCTGTAEGSIGSLCSLNSTVDAVAPGTVLEGRRAIWGLGRLQVFDGGSDNLAGTPDNTLFATQGIFIP